MAKLRWATQFLTLVLVNVGFVQVLKLGLPCPFFYCYGCPWAAFACPIGTFQHYAALQQFPFYALGAVGLFGLALGRFWCGWGCPFGTVQDLVMLVRRRGDAFKVRRVPWMKFAVLAGVILAAGIAAETLFCEVCPSGSLFAAIPHRLASSELSFGTFFYVHLATLGAALVAFFMVGRFWCRYLCPLGAVFGAFNPVSLLKVKVDLSRCQHCEECLKVCPAGIAEVEEVESCTDCTRCGKCVESCGNDAMKIAPSFRD
ncbi:MAG: 4Fe-4S binding protein [Chloroflexi bacterium]|nr:4Fe-4S binding protein [Chloroflexota bacterium]